jgi:hypothetical protein
MLWKGKNTLPLARRDARALIGNGHDRLRRSGADIDLDRRNAVPPRIVDEIAYHPPQQGWVAEHSDGLTCDGALLVSGSLLGGKRKQIDVLTHVDGLDGLQPAQKQDLFN